MTFLFVHNLVHCHIYSQIWPWSNETPFEFYCFWKTARSIGVASSLMWIFWTVADLHSKILDPPLSPIVFIFMQVSTNCGQILGWRPLPGWRIPGDARDAYPPAGPNSFIFIQFFTKVLQTNPTFGVDVPPPPRKILDPSLHMTKYDHRGKKTLAVFHHVCPESSPSP